MRMEIASHGSLLERQRHNSRLFACERNSIGIMIQSYSKEDSQNKYERSELHHIGRAQWGYVIDERERGMDRPIDNAKE